MKTLTLALLAALVLAGCAPDGGDGPTNNLTPGVPPIYGPRAGDENLTRGEVFVDSVDILTMESYPLQFAAVLNGNLPTPCHQLRVVIREPDEQNAIRLEAYSLMDPADVCAQVLEPFEQNVYLGSFPAGHYSLWVNDDMVGEFDS